MAEPDDQVRPSEPDNGESETATYGDGVQTSASAPASYSDVIWSVGEVLPATGIDPLDIGWMHQLGDGELLLSVTLSSEAPVNLDHALDQLTTALDLFDVPTLDFPSS